MEDRERIVELACKLCEANNGSGCTQVYSPDPENWICKAWLNKTNESYTRQPEPEMVLNWARAHYWDSLEPQRDLIIKHLESYQKQVKENKMTLREEIAHDLRLNYHRRSAYEQAGITLSLAQKRIEEKLTVMKAVARAGFYLPEDGVVFQDFVQSYKNTSHLHYSGNIHGDFIYSFVKGKNPATSILNGYPLQQVIEKQVENQITSLFKKHKKYSTTDLYQKIFSSLTGVLMAYIVEHLENENEMLKVEEYSNDYIDTVLRKYLIYGNDVWREDEKSG